MHSIAKYVLAAVLTVSPISHIAYAQKDKVQTETAEEAKKKIERLKAGNNEIDTTDVQIPNFDRVEKIEYLPFNPDNHLGARSFGFEVGPVYTSSNEKNREGLALMVAPKFFVSDRIRIEVEGSYNNTDRQNIEDNIDVSVSMNGMIPLHERLHFIAGLGRNFSFGSKTSTTSHFTLRQGLEYMFPTGGGVGSLSVGLSGVENGDLKFRVGVGTYGSRKTK